MFSNICYGEILVSCLRESEGSSQGNHLSRLRLDLEDRAADRFLTISTRYDNPVCPGIGETEETPLFGYNLHFTSLPGATSGTDQKSTFGAYVREGGIWPG